MISDNIHKKMPQRRRVAQRCSRVYFTVTRTTRPDRTNSW